MFARCSGEFMYAVNSASALFEVPWPTFSPYVVQFRLPCDSSWLARFGLCDSACADARCAAHPAATSEVPVVTVRARTPCCSRAWLTRYARRAVYEEGDVAALAG